MAASCLNRTFFLIFIVVHCTSAANVLILMFPFFSHIVGPANVGKVLQDEGHNVTMAIPPYFQAALAGKGLNLLLYHSLGDANVLPTEGISEVILDNYFQRKSPLSDIKRIIKYVSDRILRDKQLHGDIKAHRPDLIILDAGSTARLLTIIAYKLDIPFMFIGETIPGQFSRSPVLPSVVPSKLFDATDEMTFRQRWNNLFIEIKLYFVDHFSSGTPVSLYCPEKPDISIEDLQVKAHLWIEMHDGILDYSKPIMPNVKQVSNLLLPTEKKPLPKEFKAFMDTGKDGVVIVTFGSILKSLPHNIMAKLIAAFQQTKYKFIIKSPTSNFTHSDKFLFNKWIPQFELLSHKNTKLFITHCGSNSQHEALYAGVPMLAFPVFADQPHNAARMVRKGFGLRLDLRTFTVEELVSAIEEVITNPEYKARTKKASAIMQAALVPPVEEAAFWINHILSFGADHLRSSGLDMPLWKYLGLDILAVCLFVWHIFLFILIKMLCLCYYWCCSGQDKMKRE